MGRPLSQKELQIINSAAQHLSGELAAEKKVQAAIEYLGGLEITVLDPTGTQEYFRVGPGGRHGIAGVHVHLANGLYDHEKGWNAGALRAFGDVVGLINDPRRPSAVAYFVGLLMKALETGHYRIGLRKENSPG
jgi:hypothetical protein